jgi:hypothetical protein
MDTIYFYRCGQFFRIEPHGVLEVWSCAEWIEA